jgi:hypothetical protein
LPKWLDRILPDLHVDEPEPEPDRTPTGAEHDRVGAGV